MVKDKEFIGRVCRSMAINQPIDFSVLKVMRTKQNSIIGFEISDLNSEAEKPEIVLKDHIIFQVDGAWMNGSDLIISLLEKKINTLRREMKIRKSVLKKEQVKMEKSFM